MTDDPQWPESMDPPEGLWIEKGWLAVRLFVSPEMPNSTATTWHAEGLSAFEACGLNERVGQMMTDQFFDDNG